MPKEEQKVWKTRFDTFVRHLDQELTITDDYLKRTRPDLNQTVKTDYVKKYLDLEKFE